MPGGVLGRLIGQELAPSRVGVNGRPWLAVLSNTLQDDRAVSACASDGQPHATVRRLPLDID
jgi:hypothetical protein